MSLTRKFLTALGIESDKVDEIIKAHSETVDALKEERDSFKEKAEKSEDIQKKLDKANKTIEDLSKEDTYKVKYDALKDDFNKFKADIEAEKTNNNKKIAYKALLKEIGIADKRIDAVARLAELDKITLDENGKITGADELKKSLQEEWSDFIVKEGSKGADFPTPPANTGGGKMTKEEILAIKDTAQRQQAMLENKDLFIK